MRGYFMFVRVWAGERDLVTALVSTISFLLYISVVMLLKPEDGPHKGPKHVVVSPMY